MIPPSLRARLLARFQGKSLHYLHTRILLYAAILLGLFLLFIALTPTTQSKESHLELVLNSLVMGAILLLCLWGLLRFITYHLQDELVRFLRLFRESLTQRAPIAPHEVRFLETQALAKEANTLITTLQDLIDEQTQSLKERNQTLQNLIASQDRFLNNALHDIYTPLSVIYANTELLELKIGENPHLHKINAAAKSLQHLYADLAYLSKSERHTPAKESLRLDLFIQERVEYFSEVARGNALGFELRIESPILIHFSPQELERLCDNTLSNAIKYSHAQTNIKVLLKKQGDCATLTINNQGAPLENPARLFERYYREDTAKGGLGLGLNIIGEIAEKNRVQVEILSHPREGNSFIYHFRSQQQE